MPNETHMHLKAIEDMVREAIYVGVDPESVRSIVDTTIEQAASEREHDIRIEGQVA